MPLFRKCNIFLNNFGFSKEDACKDASKFTLYRMNHMEEPAFALRREKSAITKSHVNSGDCLILKGNTEMS